MDSVEGPNVGKMIDRILFEDEAFKVCVGLFGGMTVINKIDGITRKAPKPCVAHFMQTTEALKERGVSIEPDSPAFAALTDEFASAIFSQPGRPRWAILFGTHPDAVADRMMGFASDLSQPVESGD